MLYEQINIRKSFLIAIVVLCNTIYTYANTYYINSNAGNDNNNGTSKATPWKSLGALKYISLVPGDSVLLAKGQQFDGTIQLENIHGLTVKKIYIGGYAADRSTAKPKLDAGNFLYGIYLKNCSNIIVESIEITAVQPILDSAILKTIPMRCGVLVELTEEKQLAAIELKHLSVHDVYLMPKGYVRTAAETKTANGTQGYGWGIRVINSAKAGKLSYINVENNEIYNVSHTGLKFTAPIHGIQYVIVKDNIVHHTGGPGIQMSGVDDAHVHHNKVSYSGATNDSRNWARGSGMWTWSCNNILVEYNNFEHANGPGDSAGVHIDYNCKDVVIQYNFSANNAGGFCEILGNNYNCAYRYNVSINDGYRVKGVNGAFQEGKVFWLSGYVGNGKKNTGPFNSYFYNNTIYVSANIVPKISISSSASGVFIANNLFYFEQDAQLVAGDQKKLEIDSTQIPNVFFKNNMYLNASNWPANAPFQDQFPIFGNPRFHSNTPETIKDLLPGNIAMMKDKGIDIKKIANDTIGIKIGLQVEKDILGNQIVGRPDIGAIELSSQPSRK
ncbi:MAG TPA: right-handed parallel beta-helix repeat-containing protein [Chitinophagaceae bacterium]|nr:right-handed parallel beta-helix repeat-containing protein [Chitinophagaceae bacterium]HAN38113.1 right-handed parallel beta-helix repeat-containing protein [Chitinophagaceae bacterium]